MKRGQKAPTSLVIEAMRSVGRDELRAVEFMEARRWGDCPVCARCGSIAVYAMKDATAGARNKDFRWRCRDCVQINRERKKQKQPKPPEMFTVRTGTTFEESRLPLWVWVHAFWSCCASKKGISAMQISRECEINYKSALLVIHRVRAAMSDNGGNRQKLTGTVEVDETYVGGKPRNKGSWNKRGAAGKMPVIGIVQRGGDLRLSYMERVTADNLAPALAANIDADARLCTDESSAYTKIGHAFKGGHETVAHGKKEYARGDVHSNTIEGASHCSSAACTAPSTP
jgi:ISXO2-like transposase domain/Transposase zinc-ribbon domain